MPAISEQIEHQKPTGFLQPLVIPECKGDSLSMDLIIYYGVSEGHGNDAIWVIVGNS